MGAVDYLKQLAKSISQAGSGELSGILTDFAGTMGEVGDLAGQATRRKVASAAMDIIHSGDDYKNIVKLGGENLVNKDKELTQMFNDFVTSGSSDAFEVMGKNISTARATATGKHAELIDAFIGEQGMFGKYSANSALTGNDLYKAVTGKEKLGSIGGAYTYLMDPTYGSARRKVAIGGAAAGAVGIRYLQGGTLTRKANGENDIAGVPFI